MLSLPSFVLNLTFRSLSGFAFLGSWCCQSSVSACVFFGASLPLSRSSPCLVGPCCFCLVFLAAVGSPPCQMLLPFPPRLVPCGALAQFVRWSLPLGIWLRQWRLGCPALLLGAWLCFVVLTSFCLMAAKASGPGWGVFTLSTILHVLLGCSVWPHWGIHQDNDPGPPLVSAKLHYRYSNAVGTAFSAPVLFCHPGTPPFFVCVLFVRSGWFLLLLCFFALWWFWCALRCLWYSPLPSLRRGVSGA